MHTKTTFNAGVGFNRNGEPLDAVQVQTMAIPAIRAMLADEYGGFTESSVVGGWTTGNTVVTENGLQWVCMIETYSIPNAIHKAKEVAAKIAATLDQAAVLASVEELHYEFVTAEGVGA